MRRFFSVCITMRAIYYLEQFNEISFFTLDARPYDEQSQ